MTERQTEDVPGYRPLPMMLSKLAQRFTERFELRLGEAGFDDLSLAHSANVLRHLDAGALRASQLVERGHVSKQALSQQVAQLERAGYLVVRPDAGDQRARVLALTPRGRRAQRQVMALFLEVESEWGVALGERDAAALRQVLEKAMDRL